MNQIQLAVIGKRDSVKSFYLRFQMNNSLPKIFILQAVIIFISDLFEDKGAANCSPTGELLPQAEFKTSAFFPALTSYFAVIIK